MASRDILRTLKTEHDQLRALFEQVNATTDRAEKTRLELLEKIGWKRTARFGDDYVLTK